MPLKLNKAAYQKLIDEDIRAIRASNCDSLEREHIVTVLRGSVDCYYPEELQKVLGPFLRALSCNETDTMSRLQPDDTVLFATSGSWSGTHSVTLGDLRKLGSYFRDRL